MILFPLMEGKRGKRVCINMIRYRHIQIMAYLETSQTHVMK